MEESPKPDLSSLRIRRDEPSPRQRPPRRSRRKVGLWLLPLVLVAVVAVLYLRGRNQTFTVETAAVERLVPGSAGSVLTATGYVVAQRQAAVASKGTGRLEVLNVEEGDRVKRGEVIGRLEAGDVQASLASARAATAQAKAELEQARAVAKEAKLAFDRARGLLDRSLISQAAYDDAEARARTSEAGVEAAEAELAAARANASLAEVQVENTYIRAPFDGTVLTKNAEVGEVVAPFASSASSRGAVVTLADMGSLEVEADVSESNIRQIRLGQSCLITLDAQPAEPYRGRVKKIVPTADRAKATVLTKIAFLETDERVLPEMSAKVSFLPAEADSANFSARTVVAAPAAAVVEREGLEVVFIVRGDQAFETPVATGARYGGRIEIQSGAGEGDVVVLDPPEGLQDRGKVRTRT